MAPEVDGPDLGDVSFDEWFETPIFEVDADERLEELATSRRGPARLAASTVLRMNARAARLRARRQAPGVSARVLDLTDHRSRPSGPAATHPQEQPTVPDPSARRERRPRTEPSRTTATRSQSRGIAAEGPAKASKAAPRTRDTAEAGASRTGRAKAGTPKTSTAKTSTAKTPAAKTPAAKAAPAKTSTAKTSTAKTSTAKTSTAKTSTAKAAPAKAAPAAKSSATKAGGTRRTAPPSGRPRPSAASAASATTHPERTVAASSLSPGWRTRLERVLDRWAAHEVAAQGRLEEALSPRRRKF